MTINRTQNNQFMYVIDNIDINYFERLFLNY